MSAAGSVQARSLVIGCRIEAGASGIPSLLRVMQLIRDKKVEWSQKSELPVRNAFGLLPID